MKTHILIPEDGTRMYYQPHREAMAVIGGMPKDRIVLVVSDKVSKIDLLIAEKDLK